MDEERGMKGGKRHLFYSRQISKEWVGALPLSSLLPSASQLASQDLERRRGGEIK